MKFIEHIVQTGNGMPIFHSYVIDCSAVDAHAPGTILFGNQKNWNSTTAHTLTYMKFFQKLIDFPLEFFGLVRVRPVGWPVGY